MNILKIDRGNGEETLVVEIQDTLERLALTEALMNVVNDRIFVTGNKTVILN